MLKGHHTRTARKLLTAVAAVVFVLVATVAPACVNPCCSTSTSARMMANMPCCRTAHSMQASSSQVSNEAATLSNAPQTPQPATSIGTLLIARTMTVAASADIVAHGDTSPPLSASAPPSFLRNAQFRI